MNDGTATGPPAGLLARPWLPVLGGVVCFALLIESAGLIPAVMGTVLVASWRSRQTRWRQAFLVGTCLALGSAAVFVGLLRQPLTLVRPW